MSLSHSPLGASAAVTSALALAALAPLASCQSGKTADTPQEKPLNIVYIMTDDHTAQMMSCYDTRFANTPNLDRIAADGVRFTNSFVANSLAAPQERACSQANTATRTDFSAMSRACLTAPSPHSPNISRKPAMRPPSLENGIWRPFPPVLTNGK